jgi:uncharacterized radical SAM superfamily Fe-S cluster-containing enzyme
MHQILNCKLRKKCPEHVIESVLYVGQKEQNAFTHFQQLKLSDQNVNWKASKEMVGSVLDILNRMIIFQEDQMIK